MQTFRHILRSNLDTIKEHAKGFYGFDAFYSWFMKQYGDQMTEYELDNMASNIPALKSIFESTSTFHKQINAK